MKIGLLKLDLDVRLDTCQILTNMCLNNLITENIIPLIMNRSQTDRPKVIKELSYYVANVGKYATLEQLS
jgi:myosin-crossreactive antigen